MPPVRSVAPPTWRIELRPIRSTTLTVLASVVLAGSVTGCQFTGEEQVTGEIVIAADLELSGSAASVGKVYQRALELKVEQVNASGVLGGRNIRLDVKDNRSDPNESLRNINDFAADPAVQAIIMGSCNDCAVGAAKTVTDKRVPTIALAPASEVVTPVAERRYIFKITPNATDSAAALAAEMKRQRVRSIGLLHTDDSYGRDGQRAMSDELTKAKIKLDEVQRVKSTDTDVSQAVRALTDKDPDAIVIWTSAEQAGLAAANARASAYDGKLLFDAGAAGGLFLDNKAAGAADGAIMVFTQTMVIDDVIATTPAKAARKQWFRDYTARHGGYHGLSSFAADAVQLITDAVVDSGDTGDDVNRDGIRDRLETSQIDGLSGPIRITPDNHAGLTPQALTMLVARSGRWRLAA